MKKIILSLLLLIFSTSQVLACWGWDFYYSGKCSDYVLRGDVSEYTDEAKRIEKYREPIERILREKFDLTQRWDYMNFLVLKHKVNTLIDSNKHSGEYKDALCAINLELDNIQESQSLWVERDIEWDDSENQNIALVEQVGDYGVIDLWLYYTDEREEEKIYSGVGKFDTCRYYGDIEFNDDIYYSEDNSNSAIRALDWYLQSNWWDQAYPQEICTVWDKEFVSFYNITNSSHLWDSLNKQTLYGGVISIYGQEKNFYAYGEDLRVPSGDISVYSPTYLIDDSQMIVEANSCWRKTYKLLKNWSDVGEKIMNLD